MNPGKWALAEELFLAALERPEADREAFVGASTDDAAVAEEALALLEAHGRAGLFDRLTERTSGPARLVVGARMGAWEVVGELGTGGMGIVFLVRRADGLYEQEGALKILPSLSPGPQAEARFLAERQLLARLAHRHIAKLLDGGVSDDGRHWFVMERVEGEPLDVFCDARRLGIVERLRVFARVCEAVQYAHQNLIVHRDLKPSNILVTGEGEPRLLDFGIAKVLSEEPHFGDPSLTQVGTRVLTPEYASPEQFRGEPVTAASDVYQLGLLLWRLLAGGAPPRAVGADGEGPPTEAPTRPSRDILVTDEREAIAAARSTTPTGLARTLRGDLESILLKALRPEPDQRYGTAGQLADDVERYLAGRPVRARPDTWRYVSGKFVRRNALPLSATAGAFLLVAGLALGMRRQAVETALERDRAEQVVDLLVGLFESADPLRPIGDSVTVRAVLDRGAARIRDDLEGQPAVQAELMRVMAEVYQNLGLRQLATEWMAAALDVGTQALGRDGPEVALIERRLAMFYAQVGAFAEADSLLAVAEARLDRAPPASPLDRASALNDVGFGWQVLGRRDRAEPLLERAAVAWRLVPDAGATPAATLTNLGWLRIAAADLDSAEALFRTGLALRSSALGPDHPLVGTSLEALVDVLSRKGDLERADSALGAALAIQQRFREPTHPAILSLRVQHAQLLRRRGRTGEAEVLLREVLDAQLASLGEGHFVLSATRNELAIALREQGREREAEPYLRASLAGYRGAFGNEHVNPAIIEVSLARLLLGLGERREAEALYAHAIPILRAAYPTDRRVQVDLVDLGTLRCEAADPSVALADLEEGVTQLGAGEGRGSDAHLHALNALALCLERHARRVEALRTARDALELSDARPDTDVYRALALAIRSRTEAP